MTNPASQFDRHPPPIRAEGAALFPLPERPLQIGPLTIGFPIVQAALSGYSGAPMRIVARQLGAPYTLGEVVIDRFVLEWKSRGRTPRRLLVSEEEHPVGGQLMGSDPLQFPLAAQRLVSLGFDVIDINFGCPVKTAMGGCRGGYHLSQPAVALEIVDRVRAAVPPEIPVTLKMRRGIDDSAESRERFFKILDGAFERGAAAITVHGRTVQQKYNGPSNWDFLRAVKQHAGARTILGSGDVFTAEAAVEMLRYTGVDGVSVARGAIGNPWIFQQARALMAGQPVPWPAVAEQKRVLELQAGLCRERFDDAETLATMRTFGIKFARMHPAGERVRNAFAATRTLQQWEQTLAEWYAAWEETAPAPAESAEDRNRLLAGVGTEDDCCATGEA